MSRDAKQWDAVEEATELLLEGKSTEALEVLQGVLERDPKNAYAFFYLATAFYDIERYEAARDAYRAAVTLSPVYLGARVGLVHALRSNEELDDALAEATRLLKEASVDGDVLYAAALVHADRGDKHEAVKLLRKFIATKPDFEAQLDAKGMIDFLLKDP